MQYGRLLDIGRGIVEKKVGRTATEAAQRWSIRRALLSPTLFGTALSMARVFKGLFPRELGERIPGSDRAGAWPAPQARRARC